MADLRKQILREYVLRLLALFCLLSLSLLILAKVENMLVSFILGFVIAYLFNPIVTWLEKRRLDRSLGILLLFVAGGAIVGGSISYFAPMVTNQVSSLQTELPKYTQGIKELLAELEANISSKLPFLGPIDLGSQAGNYFESKAGGFLAAIPGYASAFLTTLILAPFFAFFMLRDGRAVTKGLLSMVPNSLFEMALNLIYQINEQLGGFVRARLMESALVGFVVWAGLALMGFPYSIFLAVFAGVTNLIPYIGPVFGAIPAFVVAFINKDSSTTLALVSAVYLTAQLLDTLLIIPLVVAKIVNLHPVTVVVVIIIGGQFMGVLGMIISIPVTSILKLTGKAVYDHAINFRV